MPRVLKTDPLSVSKREAAQRKRARDNLIAQGLPVPPELEKRPSGPPARLATEEKKQRSTDRQAKYRKESDAFKDAHRKRVARNRAIVIEAKTAPCVDCGGKFPPVCMDFDHREGETKIYGTKGGVTRLVACGSAIETLKTEIAKCDLVCANCHRLRTAKREEWDAALYE